MRIENNIIFAESGKVLYKISDGEVMGLDIVLGGEDTIENYAERELTTEEKEKYKDWLWLIQKV